MHFTQLAPPAELSALMRSYWTVDSLGADGLTRSFNTMADGLPGAMIVLPGGALLNDAEHGPMPTAFLYGQATRCRTLTANGRLLAIGVFFQPHALRSLFGFSADALTDACFDLSLIPAAGEMLAQLGLQQHANDRPALLNRFFLASAEAHKHLHDEAVAATALSIMSANGDVDLGALADRMGTTDRTFERRFKKCIGLPPRLFARIRRFQHTLHLLREGRFTKLSDIAYAADYADQSHYIRSFKQFTGISPLVFTKQGREVIENFVELPPG